MTARTKRWSGIILLAALVGGGWAYLKTRPVVLQTCQPAVGAVRAFVSEDGKTRLDEEYVVTMPINGRVRRIELNEGDRVTSGDVVARIDDFELRQRLDKLRSQVDESRLLIQGVDIAKPKSEDIESARLKVSEAQFQLESASKAVEITRITLADAEREFRRMEKLLAEGVVQRAQYDAAKRAYDTSREQLANDQIREQAARQTLEIARVGYGRIRRSVDDNEYQRGIYQAQIRQTEAEMALIRDQLFKTIIRAPVTGMILEKNTEDEQVLVAGTPLLKIGDMETIEIESDILSEEVGRIRPGQRVEITGKALAERTIEGTVKRIYPGGFKKISALGIEQQRVKVIVAFDNRELRLRPYVSVDLRFIVDEHKDVMTLSEQAVFKNGNAWAVLVIENGRLALQPIEIGLRNDQAVEIVGGLAKDAVVVAEPTNDLQPGLRARPVAP
jgi:HlyD family secretion protein